MLFEDFSIKRLARRILSNEGDFVFVGASPIAVGLTMLRQEPERDYRFVPFSGSWLRNYAELSRTTNRRNYDRLRYPQESERHAYLAFLKQDYSLSAEAIANRTRPLHLVDFCSRGGSLASFTDILIADSKTPTQAQAVATKLNLVAITGRNPFGQKVSQSVWTDGHLGFLEVSVTAYSIRHSIWWKHMIGDGQNFQSNAPRLTAPYLPDDWLSPPQPARPSNIAAFHCAAQAIDPARLQAAFGTQYP